VINAPLYPDVEFCVVMSSCAARGRAAAREIRESKAAIDNQPRFVTEPKVKNDPINLRSIGFLRRRFPGIRLVKKSLGLRELVEQKIVGEAMWVGLGLADLSAFISVVVAVYTHGQRQHRQARRGVWRD
jgi:hypothetical protein